VSAEDDIIRQGAVEAQVSFRFVHDGQCYRIIRTRRRNQASALEFQIQTNLEHTGDSANLDHASVSVTDEKSFKSLTQKGVRATQQYITQQIKIDYDTFVNSAYLRQGRADEFMLKRPSERKQVLADLLKLGRYDQLAEQAKEQARDYKAQIQPLEALLTQLAQQIQSRESIQQQYEQLQTTVKTQTATQQQCQKQLKALEKKQQQRQTLQQKLALIQQRHQHQQITVEASKAALAEAQQQLQTIKEILSQAEEIQQHYRELEMLRDREEAQSQKFQTYQQAQTHKLHLQQQQNQQYQQAQIRVAQYDAQLTQLSEQEQDVVKTLAKRDKIVENLAALKQAKKQLRSLDKIEAESAPLRQRFLQIQGQIKQAQTRLTTKIEALDTQQTQIATQQRQSTQLLEKAEEVTHRIAHLEQRREYQEAVRQKGIERRNFMERLQANQLNHELALAQLDQTLQLLEAPEKVHCPLCAQALGKKRQKKLRDRTTEERNEIQNQIWAIREQLAVSESEIQVLRQEYRALEDELAKYSHILEERGQLKAKLASVDRLQDQLQTMQKERAQLERCLAEHGYAEDLQDELKRIETQLATLRYDDRDHALVRSQVERLRWSEIKHTEIKQAERRLAQIHQQRPQIEADMQSAQAVIAMVQERPAAQKLKQIEQQIEEIGYSLEEHNQIREQLKESRVWQNRYQELQQAEAQKVALAEKVEQLEELYKGQIVEAEALTQQVEQLQVQFEKKHNFNNDSQAEIGAVEAALAQCLEGRDRDLSRLGRLQQQLSQLETVESQQEKQQTYLEDIKHKYQVYRSLAEAFGRNGIQALMIENLLPQLEAMTNQILGRLSNHQLHVQFVTQRVGRNQTRKKKKLIDTLDILIADVRGTRPYETYSGGEAFRVNFSIRLAIARLLAMRSGTALQMLIVDEGFGTQDREGCDRLIAAIEAIAPDFACILTITHMPHFREAFQTRIDVFKDETGSHIAISG
ncbi:MAG: SMC family ATPase, partial [Cyanobacteria bacterium P01_D01_bin.36]